MAANYQVLINNSFQVLITETKTLNAKQTQKFSSFIIVNASERNEICHPHAIYALLISLKIRAHE